MDKNALRRDMRAIRNTCAAQYPVPAAQFASIPPQLRAILENSTCTALYWPMGVEADPRALVTLCAEIGVITALPAFAGRAAPMEFRQFSNVTQLEPGPFGAPQPQTDAEPCAPDVLIIPLLAFDACGNRLGQGGGHYDRYLADKPASVRIGIAWSGQQIDAVPRDPHDIALNAVWTERGWQSIS